jgi:hypothetical protein
MSARARLSEDDRVKIFTKSAAPFHNDVKFQPLPIAITDPHHLTEFQGYHYIEVRKLSQVVGISDGNWERLKLDIIGKGAAAYVKIFTRSSSLRRAQADIEWTFRLKSGSSSCKY